MLEISVADLLEEKGSAGIATVLFSLVFLGAIMLSLITYQMTIAKETENVIANDIVGESTSMYSVVVSAQVLPILGAKKIDTNNQEKYFLVYGNVDHGFFVLNQENGTTVFSYDEMPGEGVIVPIDRGINNVIFVGKF